MGAAETGVAAALGGGAELAVCHGKSRCVRCA
jgi:hypothetical protein